jgi:hypothetical protein
MNHQPTHAADSAQFYLVAAAWLVALGTLILLACGCSGNYDALSDLVGVGETHDVLTPKDLELTEDARLEWCDETAGACCPEHIDVAIGDTSGYDRTHLRITVNREVVSAYDWRMGCLYLIGLVCGVPQSDDPADAMCGRSTASGLSERDIAAAKAEAQ